MALKFNNRLVMVNLSSFFIVFVPLQMSFTIIYHWKATSSTNDFLLLFTVKSSIKLAFLCKNAKLMLPGKKKPKSLSFTGPHLSSLHLHHPSSIALVFVLFIKRLIDLSTFFLLRPKKKRNNLYNPSSLPSSSSSFSSSFPFNFTL